MHLFPSFLILILLVPLPALGVDYYFAMGGVDTSPCTQDQPCLSLGRLQQLISRAKPGDTFNLRGGDVFDGGNTNCIHAIEVDGAPDQPIIMTSYGQGRAILENCRQQGILAKLADWWVIDNLEIRNSGYAVRCQGCQDWVIQHNLIHDLDRNCVNLQPYPPHDPLGTPTERVNIRHNTCYETGKTGHGEGIYINTGSTQDIVIEHNELFHLRDEGVNCKGDDRNIVIRHNYIHSAYPPDDESSINRGRLHRLGQWFHKWVASPAYAGENPSEDSGIKCRFGTGDNVMVERNIIENMPYAGIILKQLSNAVAQYNLIVNANRAISSDDMGTQIAFNTIYNNNNAQLGVPPTHYESNIAWGNQAGNDPTDPQFINAEAGDFNLALSSNRRMTGSDGFSQGIFHSPEISGCEVVNRASNTLRCTTGPIRFPPLRCPDPTAFQVSVNGIPRGPATSCVAVSDAEVQIDIPGPDIGSTDAVTVNAAYGALQDSAWIGGMTSEGNCLAELYICNSMSTAIVNQPVAIKTWQRTTPLSDNSQ